MWVAPRWIGTGVGRRLFAHLLRRLDAAGVRRLRIAADPNAAGFYRAMGGRRAGSVASKPASRRLPLFVLRIGARAAALVLAVVLAGCRGDATPTLDVFERSRTELAALVTEARGGVPMEELEKRHPGLCPSGQGARSIGLGCEYARMPLVVEVTPVDVYFVLVFAEGPGALATSRAMRDEGRVARELGDGWTLVRRGFM
jgi:hypothetical protein